MLQKFNISSTIAPLLIGFSVFIALFFINWSFTSSQLEEYEELNATMEIINEQMEIVNRLIAIARTRTRLSHEMLLAEDVFERDEIAMNISSMAGEFEINRRKLISLNLHERVNTIMESQLTIYPIIIGNLNLAAELALQDTNEATERARNIIIREIMPAQDEIIDGFATIMRILDDKVHHESKAATRHYQDHQRLRLILLFFILLVSIITIAMVINNILRIERRLQDLSKTDPLTGILNRRAFDETVRIEWKNTSRCNKPLSVLLIDIDHFKKYNDYYGHQAGDDILIRVASLIQRIAHRAGDIVARYGGEEFIVVLPAVDHAGACKVANRLLEAVRKERIPHEDSDTESHITISIGHATILPSRSNTIEELIRAADDGLYESKNTGRNKVSCMTSNTVAEPA